MSNEITYAWDFGFIYLFFDNWVPPRLGLPNDERDGRRWQWRRLWNRISFLAIDGSTVKIPRTSEVENHFGLWSVNSQNPCPLARISQIFDVLNKITVDAIIAPKAIGERELCESHFMKLMPNDLVLLDRGYPAYWLFNLILSWDGNFCARVQVENFTGKSVLSVYQDFHARIFSKNLTAMLAFPTRRDIEQNNDDKLHQYQINFTQAVSKMKVLFFLQTGTLIQ